MLILSFDTATDVATSALVRDGTVLGERASRAIRILADVEVLLGAADAGVEDVEAIVVGTGPGSYTGLRMGLVTARTLAFSLDVTVAGISTLAALAAGAPDALPVIDARRRQLFTLLAGQPVVLGPEELEVEEGTLCVGDGAVRFRALLEEAGAVVPPDDAEVHIPWARHHAALAQTFGPAELAQPIYLRAPDAERAIAR